MTNNFLPIQPILPLGNTAGMFTKGVSGVQIAEGEGSFASFFNKELSKLNDGVNAPNKMAEGLATGDLNDIHKISVENAKADVLLKLATKILSSAAGGFRTFMQMQI